MIVSVQSRTAKSDAYGTLSERRTENQGATKMEGTTRARTTRGAAVVEDPVVEDRHHPTNPNALPVEITLMVQEEGDEDVV